ncbi:MAG: CvpA family protein [Thiothrix sp.]|nr:MAG: CvpA family protein [Thiothrix sp.]
MHWVDIIVFVVIGFSVVIGLFRGLVKEAISLATWILGVWVGLSFASSFGEKLPFQVGDETVQMVIAFAIIFLVILVVGGIVNYLIGQLVDKTGLSGTDRSMGLVFGFLRGGLIISIMVLLATLTNMPNEDWWKQSMTLPFFYDVAVYLKDLLPESLAQHFS